MTIDPNSLGKKEYGRMEVTNIPAPRTPISIEVEFKKNYAREATSGVFKNISLTGAFIQHQMGELKPGEKLSVRFNVCGRLRNIAAHVVWSNKLGAGVRFVPTNNRDVQIVDDFIYFAESKREGSKDVFGEILTKVA
jgi:hypothetical protein